MDQPPRPSVMSSTAESTSIPSSTFRSIDDQLGAFFIKDRLESFTDVDFEKISFLLQNSGRHLYSPIPRIYSVLRIIDRLEVLDDFIKSDATDLSFPFTATSFPPTVGVEVQYEFLQSQSLVLTKALDLEKGERGGHVHFGKDELIPYEVRGRLGTGGYGEVEKVVSLLSHREFARKKIRRARNQRANQQQIKDFLGELRILKRLSHIHCVRMIGSYTDHKYFALLISPVADCNLATYMTESIDSKDKQSLLRTFFGCLSNGIQFLHESKIRHRDVKPENVLVKGANVLWTDFGISLDWAEMTGSTTTADSAKSPVYCAPEVANYEPRNSSADIWSLGCVFLEMTTILKGQTIAQMRQSFKNYSENYRFYANMKPVELWIESLHNLGHEQDNEPLKWIKTMLTVNPHHRPTAEAIFNMIIEEQPGAISNTAPRTFSGSCCVETPDLSSESDGEAWFDVPEEAVQQAQLLKLAKRLPSDPSLDQIPNSKDPVNDSEDTIKRLALLDLAEKPQLQSSSGLTRSTPQDQVFAHINDVVAAKPDVDSNGAIHTLLIQCEMYNDHARAYLDSGRPDLALSEYIRANIIALDIIPRHNEFLQLKKDRGKLHQSLNAIQNDLSANYEKFEEAKMTIKENNKRHQVASPLDDKSKTVSLPDEHDSAVINRQFVKIQSLTSQTETMKTIDTMQRNPSGESTSKLERGADDYDSMMTTLLPVDPELVTSEQAHHTWYIKDWKKLEQQQYSPVFHCGGFPWRILLHPLGNSSLMRFKNDTLKYASLYLECGFGTWQAPENWYACTKFAIVLWSPRQSAKFVSHATKHRFTKAEPDWGFTKFCDTKKLPISEQASNLDSSAVQLEAVNITVYLRIVKDPTGVLWHNFLDYDSKKETGRVGIKNQGATAYLNTLLQCLYFLNAFRKAVYQIPTERSQLGISAKPEVVLALQRLFYSLQTSKTSVSTKELTQSFGWGPKMLFEPQDVFEMSKQLIEQLEGKMKGTPVEKALSDLFVGRLNTYISCINVDHTSLRSEDFWDLEMNVRNNRTLNDSFREFVEVEKMDGDFQWYTGAHGLQDAVKGFTFEMFPPILQLRLKRYQYDFNLNTMTKLDDYHEFPEEFDASPYLSATADRSEPCTYLLVGVIVHDGDINKGHNYVFMRSAKHRQFYKFDDERVNLATNKEAIGDNFGDFKRGMSAYMLIYVRNSRLGEVFADIPDSAIPHHLTASLALKH